MNVKIGKTSIPLLTHGSRVATTMDALHHALCAVPALHAQDSQVCRLLAEFAFTWRGDQGLVEWGPGHGTFSAVQAHRQELWACSRDGICVGSLDGRNTRHIPFPPEPTREIWSAGIRFITLPSFQPYEMAVSDDVVAIASISTLCLLTPAGELRQRSALSGVRGLCIADGELWVTLMDRVRVWSLSDPSVRRTIWPPVAYRHLGRLMVHGDRVYVLDRGTDGIVYVLDRLSGKLVQQWNLPRPVVCPNTITCCGDVVLISHLCGVYVCDWEGRMIRHIDGPSLYSVTASSERVFAIHTRIVEMV